LTPKRFLLLLWAWRRSPFPPVTAAPDRQIAFGESPLQISPVYRPVRAQIVKTDKPDMALASALQLQQLIGAIARRDRAAFAALYAQTAAKLFGVSLRILQQRELAEEALQESFFAIWQRAGDYDPARGSAIGWLMTIVRHCAIDQLRRRTARPESRSAPEEALMTFAAAGSADSGAELRALQRCLDELDEPPRRAVLLAYCYGLTREELAARLGVPVGTVKSWLRRSLERLQKCLDG
jgi:RNA polymerase sigma-70 factor, ECF subfamily